MPWNFEEDELFQESIDAAYERMSGIYPRTPKRSDYSSQRPFDPGPLSNIRERALNKTLDRLEALTPHALRMLEGPRTGLSLGEMRLNAQYVQLLQGAKQRLRDEITFVRRQDAAETAMDEAIKKLTPLQRSRRLSRTLRYTSIAGLFQRDPSKFDRVARDVNARVKSRDAARRRMDAARAVRYGSPFGVFGTKSDIEDKLGFGFMGRVRSAFNPCEARDVRREVLHATRQNKGHRSKKHRSVWSLMPC